MYPGCIIIIVLKLVLLNYVTTTKLFMGALDYKIGDSKPNKEPTQIRYRSAYTYAMHYFSHK
jgi:hypothetical protein